jgi:photosystem II stability/assembly factor-like uncharacterized protein
MFPVRNFIVVLLLLFVCFIQSAKADWVKQNSNTLAWLQDVYFLDEQTGWIAGSGGTFLKTADGGRTWTKEKNFTTDLIRQVYFTDERNGWLLCERNLFALGTNSPSFLLKTSDGGFNWERIEFSDSQRKRITKVLFSKNGDGLAIGEGGAFFSMSNEKQDLWKRVPSPVRYLMFDGIFTDESHGIIVGAGGSVLFTEDEGLTWNKASVLGDAKAKLNRVFFVNPKNGWTVGSEGKIYQTFNAGKTWREQKSNVSADLTDVFFNNTAEGWAVGDAGTILYTTTAGNVWTTINSKDKHKLERVFFVGRKGWAVGFGGTILFYDENKPENKFSVSAPKLKSRN